MKVRFRETRIVQDGSGTIFKAGTVYDLPDASAARWMRRGLAEPVFQLDPPPSDPPPALDDASTGAGDAPPAGDDAEPPSKTFGLQLDASPRSSKGTRSRKS